MNDAIEQRRRLAAVSHQLRNPLSAIQGALDLLLDPAGPGADQREMLELIERQVQAITQIIDELVDG